MSKIDEKTLVPLHTVVGLFVTGIVVTSMGVFWVTSVNDRLGRIEQKLGINPIEPPAVLFHTDATGRGPAFIHSAEASSK